MFTDFEAIGVNLLILLYFTFLPDACAGSCQRSRLIAAMQQIATGIPLRHRLLRVLEACEIVPVRRGASRGKHANPGLACGY